ncbi:MAG: uncharacterized protein KVP18_001449 [Porospora cf. gigantea A]|uniref:uncharacterized protein n=2 Tax=Porospora cf. gigantea A TaxID=2853593 RepID=UPI00355A8759|nr:MAG: hypothetical protein KVP18_001449 [Porospora cf. gigantea A]
MTSYYWPTRLMNEMLQTRDKWTEQTSMEFSAQKCWAKLALLGKALEGTDDHSAYENKEAKASKAIYNLKRVCEYGEKSHPLNVRTAYLTFIRSILLYGSEALTEATMKRLGNAKERLWRELFHLGTTISGKLTRALLEITPMTTMKLSVTDRRRMARDEWRLTKEGRARINGDTAEASSVHARIRENMGTCPYKKVDFE